MRVRLLALALIALCCAPLEVAASSNYEVRPLPFSPLLDPRLPPTPDVLRRRRGAFRAASFPNHRAHAPPAPPPIIAGGFAPTTTAL